ncbi:hypothetical protein ACHAWF_013448 [Thalassiosira exigua]
MKFWRRGDPSASVRRSGSSSSSLGSSLGISGTLSRKASAATTPRMSASVPTRKQRMQLLKRIIHHADVVQKQYIVQKKLPSPAPKPSGNAMSIDNMSSIFARSDPATDEINDKCYQRWHQVLQEGLVPMSVRALNLLEKTELPLGNDAQDDEEEAYFATMEGMDEEIQVMAVLARAAALNDVQDADACIDNKADDGMGQINAMMKCSAMLLFHVVLAASSSDLASDGSSAEQNTNESAKGDKDSAAATTVPGYDGRVRHVMKLACVDALARAIVESVESYDGKQAGLSVEEEPSSGVYDMDQYSLWNIATIKSFIEQTELGKDAVFGTPYIGSGGKQEKRQSEVDGQTLTSGEVSNQLPLEANERSSNDGEIPPTSVESIASKSSSDSSSSLEVQTVEVITQPLPSITRSEDDAENECGDEKQSSQCDAKADDGNVSQDEAISNTHEEGHEATSVDKNEENKAELKARRQFNAKFLATRKFELIERLVAVDIVRFLMAKEYQRKQHLGEQAKNSNKKFPLSFSSSVADEQKKEDDDKGSDEADQNENGDGDDSNKETSVSSKYLTPSRIKQIQRGAKIAGAGLALGTGGLAAPALAAGIGGIAALTGATTASSTALLAVLATFKAGAALFGVGGGGLAAYKMKKRTAGLSQFEIRRENIQQFMYDGASDENMKKGIEAMLPQLHTTVAVAGWLRDNDISDFQLAWGVQPTCQYENNDDNKLRIRQLKRFYAIYNPPLVNLCENFMQTLQKKLKKDFSWDRIWDQLERKYGVNPDHMIPLDRAHDNEIFLSYEEKEMIDGVLNIAKVHLLEGGIDLNESDEISDLLAKVSPQKRLRDSMVDGNNDRGLDKSDLLMMEKELVLDRGDGENQADNISGYDNDDLAVDEDQPDSSTEALSDEGGSGTEMSPTLQERMAKQREQQLVFLKDQGIVTDESNLKEGAGSPKMACAETSHRNTPQDPPANIPFETEEFDERCPVVWDWRRLYGTADIHTVSWESNMLSSLCHIVENMAIEVSSQATKVALQYSVVGAIVSAVAIPSALLTASKLIDDPYQIVVIRADEAGKELARCLLQSDERRPVTLVGFSFGARVIHSCLRELARQQDIWEECRARKPTDRVESSKSSMSSFLSKKTKEEPKFEYDREPASLVGDVVFIGLPRSIDKKVLTSCRRVTGGRLVNCYTRNDWLMSLMFIARGGTPCGTKAIAGVPELHCMARSLPPDAIPSILQHIRFSEP